LGALCENSVADDLWQNDWNGVDAEDGHF